MITDLGVLEPAVPTRELTLTAVFEGVDVDAVHAACGWSLRVADAVSVVTAPTDDELRVLRDLHFRTHDAHARRVRVPLPF